MTERGGTGVNLYSMVLTMIEEVEEERERAERGM
jgi:hypothetical protein